MTAPGEDTAVAFGTSDYDFSQSRRDQELWFVPVVRLFQGDPDYLLVSIDDLLKGAKGEEHVNAKYCVRKTDVNGVVYILLCEAVTMIPLFGEEVRRGSEGRAVLVGLLPLLVL